MTLCRNNSLSNENCITYGAVLTFCETGFCAGGSNSFINHFSMTLCRNNSLSNKNCVTYGAVLTFCKTGFGAGCSNGFINYFSMRFFCDFGDLALFSTAGICAVL